ncbi:uncharacterized protein LOC107636630 [Arachis ipaensis]|uniref:uncharacterized protein LOC107636630 n=1 Tax=Arachis ipaensis TaxID=130454 RepID=UPI0007AFE130|nr:uncharacterized protein LOC107636630 [Arachis ipaensis]
MEWALQAQQVSEEKWVEFGTYQLQGEAQYWWQGTRRILQPDRAMVPWEVFRTEFYKKYFPSSARNAKELELLQLKQGQMTIEEYTNRVFSELVNKSRVDKECLRKVALDKGDHRASVRGDQGRNFAPRGQDFKRGGNIPQQHQGQNNFRRFNNNNNQGRGYGKQAQFLQDDLTCRRCRRYHPNTPFRASWDVCYYCGRAGHMSWNCLEKKSQEARRAL